eukprot:EC720608.1.p3 GENE.EC720608.1~~EC720608.1.p3  ORF type:complete len:57 (-),score=7.46 EC720608.1:329-499(-)
MIHLHAVIREQIHGNMEDKRQEPDKSAALLRLRAIALDELNFADPDVVVEQEVHTN